MSNWLSELGAKRTPFDPDGSAHRRSWWGFILVMVVLIGALVAIQSNADAAEKVAAARPRAISIDCPSGTNSLRWSVTKGKPDDYNLNFALTQVAVACTRSNDWVKGPRWEHTYAVHHFWEFSKWLKDRFRNFSGVGQAPNGVNNVPYETNVVVAEFKLCPPYVQGLCAHKTFGTKVQVWANGQGQVWVL